MRSESTTAHRSTRIVLLLGCLAGLTTYLLTPLEQPAQLFLASDVYLHAVDSFLDGGPLYETHPADRPGYTFLYPPITVLVFLPHVLTGSTTAAFLIQTGLNVLAAVGTALVCYRALRRRDLPVTRADLGVMIAFMLLSSYSAIQFMNGQVNLWLAFLLAIGFDAIDRDRARIAGFVFAAAALLKVFPAIIGLWLLRIRRFRAAGAAILTGVGGLVAGAILFGPDLTVTYLGDVLIGRFEGSTYTGRPDPGDNVDGMHRQLAAFWPAGQPWHTPIAFVVLGGLLAAVYTHVSSTRDRDVAALATIVAILLFLPLQPLYFPLITFPLFMLLYRPLPKWPRRVYLLGTLLTFVHIDVDAIDLWLTWIPMPTSLADPLVDISPAIFTVILPPTLGLWVLLGTCVWLQFHSLPELDTPDRTAPAPAPG